MLFERYLYPENILDNYFFEKYPPNTSLRVSDKLILVSEVSSTKTDISQPSVALHIHVFYVDVFEKILIKLGLKPYIDLYITTTQDNVLAIESLLSTFGYSTSDYTIVVVENRGRDILPWLKICDRLSKYEIAGHFHTKKSAFYNQDWFGDAWMEDVNNTLVMHSDLIINYMTENKMVGIVISEMPYFFKYLMKACPFDGSSGRNRANINALWGRMKIEKECNFFKLQTPIMPYGNMFWYRPKALEPLTSLVFNKYEFKEEPLGRDGELPHAIERLPVYVAWSQGYDFRIVITKDMISTGFDYKNFSTDIVSF